MCHSSRPTKEARRPSVAKAFSRVTSRDTDDVYSNPELEPGGTNGRASGSKPCSRENSDSKRKGLDQADTSLPGTIASPRHSDPVKASGPSSSATGRMASGKQKSETGEPSSQASQSQDSEELCFSSHDSMVTQQDTKDQGSEKIKDQCSQEKADKKADEKADEKEEAQSSSSSRTKVQTQDVDFRQDWHLEVMFAEGTSSVVHRCTRKDACTSRNPPAVIKVSRPGKESELIREAKYLQHLGRHPHVVELLGFYHSKQYGTALVLELLDGGEVLQLVEQPCSEMHIRIVAIQVCQALGFIHSRGIVHRDVKAENIVLSGRGGEVKLVDFGLAGFENDDEAMMTRCGSPGYIAPEVIEGTRCSSVADIFGLGVVVYLLIAGRLPFRGKTPTDVLRRNLRCNVKFEDDIWFGLADCQSFVSSLLVKDPNERPAAVDVWRHPWFTPLIREETSAASSSK